MAIRGVRILRVAVSSAITAQAHAAAGPSSAAASSRDDKRRRRGRPPKHWHREQTGRKCRDAKDWAQSCRAGAIEMRLHDGERRTTSKS